MNVLSAIALFSFLLIAAPLFTCVAVFRYETRVFPWRQDAGYFLLHRMIELEKHSHARELRRLAFIANMIGHDETVAEFYSDG